MSKDRETISSEESERGVLSCMFQSMEVLRTAAASLSPDAFSSGARRTIFEQMVQMEGQGHLVDLITISARLRDRGELDKVGGVAELADILSFAPAPVHFPAYRDILLEKWALRRLLSVATKLRERALSGDEDSKKILEATDRELTEIHQALGNHRVSRTRHIRAILADCVSEVEAWQTGEKSAGISTGIIPFDRQQLLLRPNGYFVVAAPTNTGKSTMLAQMVLHALDKGHRVAIASVEDSAIMFGHRMTSHRSKVPLSKMTEKGSLSEYDFSKYNRAVSHLEPQSLQILHNGKMTTNEFRHWARRQVLDFGAEIIALDYLQRMSPSTKMGGNTATDAVNEASATVKELANDLGVCFLVSVQTNRMRGRKARLDDLKQSGNIEQDATEVLILQRRRDIESGHDEEEGQEGRTDDRNASVSTEVVATIAKQKNGGHSEHTLYLFGDTFRFEAPARDNA